MRISDVAGGSVFAATNPDCNKSRRLIVNAQTGASAAGRPFDASAADGG